MRKLLSLVALCCAMALAFGGFAPRASAAQLPTGLLALKTDRVGAVQDVRYRCWWRDGYRRCGWVRQFDAYGNYIGRVRSCY